MLATLFQDPYYRLLLIELDSYCINSLKPYYLK